MSTNPSMRLVISPAKTMVEAEPFRKTTKAQFCEDAILLSSELAKLSLEEQQALWNCSAHLAQMNRDRLEHFDPLGAKHELTPAGLAYEGIQYKSLSLSVMTESELAWTQEHLRILSGMYGLLRPLDGIDSYRLEMQAKFAVAGHKNLYEYWGDRIAKQLAQECDCIINLASVEYSKVLSQAYKKMENAPEFYTCLFGSMKQGKFKQASVEAKVARGTFARWCAEREVSDLSELRSFTEFDYAYNAELSDEHTLVFVH